MNYQCSLGIRLRAYFNSDANKLQSYVDYFCREVKVEAGDSEMNIRHLLKRGISLKKQRSGWPADGPLSPAFRELSKTTAAGPASDESQGEGKLKAISPIGMDLARIYSGRSLWVLYVNTSGSGIAPWRGMIILDADYRGEGQIRSPASLGMVAHELTHLLQREFNQPHYWPGGGINPVRGRRWIGDSTNYMEVIAYLVGWTVEYDFTLAKRTQIHISPGQKARDDRVLATIRDRLALFTGSEERKASWLITDLFPDNPIYKQNYQVERRYPDRRIPPGAWPSWLRQMGFSRAAVDHIMVLAAQGQRSSSASSA